MRFTVLTILLFSYSFIFGQLDPVKWTVSKEKQKNSSYKLIFTATMDDDWVIYSQHTDPNGPVPTSFMYNNTHCLDGAVKENSKAVTLYSDLFMVDVIKFKKEAIFVQNIKADCGELIEASIEFMTCNGDRCLPPKEVKFEIAL